MLGIDPDLVGTQWQPMADDPYLDQGSSLIEANHPPQSSGSQAIEMRRQQD